MKLNLKVSWIKKLKASKLEKVVSWYNDDQWREVDIEAIADTDLMLLLQMMDKHKDVKGSVAVKQKIGIYLKLKANPGGTKVTKLEAIVTAVREMLMPTPHKWLFTENEDGRLVPWYVYNVVFHEYDHRNDNPAHTDIHLAALKRERKETRTITYRAHEIKGATAYELLKRHGYFVETEAIVADYTKENQRYQDIRGLTGEQFLATGRAFVHEDYYSHDHVEMECDGEATKVVMDDVDSDGNPNERDREIVVSSKFWTEDKKSREDDGGENEEQSVIDLPLQPYVKIFDLSKHNFAIIHVANLTEYVYDQTLVDKLVLSEEKKRLVTILVTGADKNMEDIVRGKTGGIIVIATGPPGTGKTLTAEVFSERIKRPLYAVQCSQLGTDEETLEKKLRVVLSRAQRWKAILLLDESDVYVHERGDDICQNAIVGVFLRVLEYYRGVLFMTTNRATIIDDAIMSRATARITYEIPDEKQRFEIWRVLNSQYQTRLDDSEMVELAKDPKFGFISGRSIKNMLKLARLESLADPNDPKEITVEMIRYVSQFIDLECSKPKDEPT